jgi:DNA-binding SARP family transcriptional activator
MALSVLVSQLAADLGRLVSEPLADRLPWPLAFGGGMLAGGLTVALVSLHAELVWAGRIMGQLPATAPSAETAVEPPAPQQQSSSRIGVLGAVDAPAQPQVSSLRIGVLGPVDAPAQPQVSSLRIGVLGFLTINGQAGALVPAQSQLIVLLALHPDGLSNTELRIMLGADPAHPKPAGSLRQLIARTRRAIGRANDGHQWIEHLGHGRYGLHPDARVDWRDFEALIAEGMTLARTGPLTDALSMVRGQPFSGCYYWWIDAETIESVTVRIVAAAEALAELCLADLDPAAAARACRIGLTADPSAERLWRILMRAEHAAGNLAAVREAWSRCSGVIAEVAVDGRPDPATEAIYRALTATGHQEAGTSRSPSSRIFPGCSLPDR